MAQDGGAGSGNGASSIGDEEPALRVGLGARLGAMVGAEGSGDLMQRLRAFRPGVALPVERESLAADGATDVGGVAGGLAKYLHS